MYLSFTAPSVSVVTDCFITAIAKDGCGRETFYSWPVRISPAPVNRTPVVRNDSATIAASCNGQASLSLNVLSNDSDPDGQPLSASLLSVTNGTATLSSSGNLVFKPSGDNGLFSGMAYVQYKACDNNSPTPACTNGTVVVQVGSQNTYGCWSNESWGLGDVYSCDTMLNSLIVGLDVTGSGNADDVENAYNDPDAIGCELDNLADRLTIGYVNNTSQTMKLNLDTILIYWKPVSNGGTGNPTLKVELSTNGSSWVNAATYTRSNTGFVTDTLKNPLAGAQYARLSVTANAARRPQIDAIEFRRYQCNPIEAVAENGVYSILEDQSARISVLSMVTSARGLPDSLRRLSNGPYNGYASFNPDQTVTYTPFQDFDGKDSFTYTVVNTRNMQSSGKIVINVQPDLCSSGQRGGSYKDTTVGVVVDRDAYLRQERATTNYGNENRLKMGWGDRNNKEYRSVLYFNLNTGGAAIPTSATVLDAKLELYRKGGKDNVQVDLHKITGSALFVETQVNWTRRLNATNWATAGGDFAASASGQLSTGSGGSANNAWHYSSQLSTLVQDWVTTPANNLGVLAKRTGSYKRNDLAQFESDDATRKPILRVRYSSVSGCQVIPNQKPMIVADYDTVTFPASVTRNVVSNDRDPQGTALNLTTTAPIYKVFGGTATRSGNSITFSPSSGFVGTGYVEYRVTDGSLTDTGWYFITCLNAPPVAVKDSAAVTATGSAVTINVLANDYDPEGATLTPEVLFQGKKGNAERVGTQIKYTSQAPLTGLDTFWYRISEPLSGQCSEQQWDTAFVVMRILNRKPDAKTDTAHAEPCESILISVLDNDTDPDGHNLLISSIVSQPKHGTASITSGKITYTGNSSPTPFTGLDSFRYSITDDGIPPSRDSAWAYLRVQSSVNLKPVAVNDTFEITTQVPYYLRTLDNDSDPEGRPLVIRYDSAFFKPRHGHLHWYPNSSMLAYTSDPGFSGLDSFRYIIRDTTRIIGTGCPPQASKYDTATVYALVLYSPAPNNLTYAINDNNNTWKDIPVRGKVLTNDFDLEYHAITFNSFFRQDGGGVWLSNGDTLSGTNQAGSAVSFAGTLQFNSTGTYLFTPAHGFTGLVRVPYGICDSDPASPSCDTAFLNISVDPMRSFTANGLIAEPDVMLTCKEAIRAQLLRNDDDAEGDSFRISGWLMDSNGDAIPDSLIAPGDTVWVGGVDYLGYPQYTAGRMSMNASGACYFLPDYFEGTRFVGQVYAAYLLYDNGSPVARDTALLKIEVLQHNETANERPFVGDDFVFTEARMSVSASWAANDFEPNGDSVRLNGSTIRVKLSALPSGASILASMTTDSGGSVVFYANGQYRYTPAAGFTGPDQVRYTLCDVPQTASPSRCAEGTIYFQTGFNDSTIAVNDVNFTWMNTPVDGEVCINDVEPGLHNFDAFYNCSVGCSRLGDTAVVSGFGMEGAPVDTAGVFITSNCGYRFLPADGFTGHIDLWYVVCDKYFPFHCDTAMLRVNVDSLASTNGNNLIATNDYMISYGDPVQSMLLRNDADPEGDAFAFYAYRYDSNGDGTPETAGTLGDTIAVGGLDADGMRWTNAGSFVVFGNGSCTFIPASGYYGTVKISYTIRDSGSLPATDEALLFITVLPSNGVLNDRPFAGDDLALTQIGKPVTGIWAANDLEPNGDSVLLNGNTLPLLLGALPAIGIPLDTLATLEGGHVVLYSDGSYIYYPDTGFIGPDRVVYTLCDKTTVYPQPLCASATIYLLVSPLDPTVAVNDYNNTWQNITVSGNMCTNDFDQELHTQTFTNLMTADTVKTVLYSPALLSGIDMNGNHVDTAGVLYFTACSYTFVPARGFTGTARVSYSVCDNGVPSACDTAILSISVDSLPKPTYNNVIANHDMGVCINTSLSSNVLLNDGDPEGDSFGVIAWYYDADGYGFAETPAAPGTTQFVGGRDIYGFFIANAGTILLDSNGDYTFTPTGGYYGTVALAYTIRDNGVQPTTDEALLYIHSLQPNGVLNDPPFAGDDFAMTRSDSSVLGTWGFNDVEPNGDSVALIGGKAHMLLGALSGPGLPLDTVFTDSGGTVIFYSNGSFLYTPGTGYFGPDRVLYTLCDLNAASPSPLCASATVYLLVYQAPIVISGTVYNDANGGTPGGRPFNNPSGSPLYAYLLNNGVVEDSARVRANGTYSFDAGRAYDTYSISLTTLSVPIGSPAPARILPANWQYVSEALGSNNGSGNGNDALVNGLLPLITGPNNPAGLNFGLNYLPFAHDKTYSVNPDSIYWKTGAPKGGFERILRLNALSGTNDTTFNSGSSADMPGKLSGFDLEEGRINGLTGGSKYTLVLETLPDTTEAVLAYPLNGKVESFFDVFFVIDFWDSSINRYVIPNFNPDSLFIKFKLAGQSSTSFQYSYRDSSGMRGRVATYTFDFSSPLPLTLTQFRCDEAPSGVLIQWAAIAQSGTEQFGILHSSDGKNWKLLHTIQGRGAPGELTHYWWKHERPQPGLNAYRLSVSDELGNIMQGPICATNSNGEPLTSARLYPNPARSNCRLAFQLTQEQDVDIRIMASSGKEARCLRVRGVAGNNDIEIMLDELEAGLYYLSADGPQISARFRLVLQD